MVAYYLDTSALVKLYVREAGTDRMRRLFRESESDRFVILSLAQVELNSAVRRRERENSIDAQSASRIIAEFTSHLLTIFHTQEVNEPVLNLACSLVDRHPLRAYDAMQLAGVSVLSSGESSSPVFVSADRQLLRAAGAEGLHWMDPLANHE